MGSPKVSLSTLMTLVLKYASSPHANLFTIYVKEILSPRAKNTVTKLSG